MAHSKSSGELAGELSKAAELVATGATYKHRITGCLYRVATLSLREATLGVDVIYRCASTGLTWTRPLQEFAARFERVPDEEAAKPAPLPPRPVLTEADKEELRRILREEYRGTINTGRAVDGEVIVIPFPVSHDQSADAADLRAQAALVKKFAAKPWLLEDALALLQDTATLYKGDNLSEQARRILTDLELPERASDEYDIAHRLYHRPRLAAAVLEFVRLVLPTCVESDDTPTRVRHLFKLMRQFVACYCTYKGAGR